MTLSHGSEPRRRSDGPRRARAVALRVAILVSAAVFLFSVAGIARTGEGSKPSASVVSAARDVVESESDRRGTAGDGYFFDDARRERGGCRKRSDRRRTPRSGDPRTRLQ